MATLTTYLRAEDNTGPAIDSASRHLQQMESATAQVGGRTAALSTIWAAAARDLDSLSTSAGRTQRIEELTQRLNTQQKALGLLERDLTQVSAKYGESSVQAQRKQLSIDRMNLSITRTQRTITDVATAFAVETRAAEEAAAAVDAKADALEAEARAADDAADESKNLGASFNSVNQMAIGATRAVGGLAVVVATRLLDSMQDAAAETVDLAGDFEASLNRFSSVAGDSLEEAGLSLDDFGDLALEMGAKTQFSAGQAGDAMVELAKGGVDPLTQSAGGLEAALNLAAAGELELATAAEIGAKQLGVWVDSAADADEKARFLAQTADLLSQAANASTVGVEDLALGMSQAGLAARTAGLEYNETVQTMALLAPGFASASDAGTSFKTFLQRLIPVTADQRSAMIDLGLATEDGSSKFYDATGSFIGMDSAMALLHEQTKDLSEEQRSLAFNTIFGSDALRAAAIIADQGADGYANMGKAMNAAGSAADQAAQRNRGLNFAMESLSGSFETLEIVVGTAAIPTLTRLIENVLIPATNNVTEFAKAVSESDDPLATFTDIIGDVSPALGLTIDGLRITADVIRNGAIPALTTLTAYSTAYAVTSLPQMTVAVGRATTAITTHAGAMTAALGPYALLAGAVYLAIDVNRRLDASYLDLINQRDEDNRTIQESIRAQRELNDLRDTTDNAEQVAHAKELSDEIDRLNKVHDDLNLKLERAQAGWRNGGGFEDLTAAVAENEIAIRDATKAADDYALHIEASKNRAEFGNAIQNWRALENAAYDTGTAAEGAGRKAVISAEDLAKIAEETAKVFEDTATEITSAFDSLGTTEASYLQSREDARRRHEDIIAGIIADAGGPQAAAVSEAAQSKIAAENASFAESQQNAARAYAEEQAAQRTHLGQMLIDRIQGLAQLANADPNIPDIAAERVAEMVEAVRLEFGVLPGIADANFADVNAVLQRWSENPGIDASNVIAEITKTEQEAADLKAAYDRLIGTYTADIEAQLDAGVIALPEYEELLRRLPARVVSEVLANGAVEGKNSVDSLNLALSQVPPTTAANILSNAASVAGEINNVSLAMRSVPPTKLVRIDAMIDGNLVRRSPAPIEQVFATIEKFTARAHQVKVDTAGLDSVKDLLSMVSQIGGASESLSKVNDFDQPTDGNLVAVFDSMEQAASIALDHAKGWSKEMSETVGLYSETTANAADAAGSGAENLSKVADAALPSREALLSLSYTMRDATADAYARAVEIEYALNETTDRYIDTTARAAESAGTSAENLAKVADAARPSREALLDWSFTMRDAVADAYARGEEVTYALTETTDRYLETAQHAGETIGATADGLESIRDWEGPIRDSLLGFSYNMRDIVADAGARSREVEGDLTELTDRYLETAGKAGETIGAVAEGLSALQDWEEPTREALVGYFDAAEDAVREAADRARNIEPEAAEAGAAWAQSAGAIMEPIQATADAFDAVEDVRRVPAEKIDLLIDGMELAADKMQEASGRVNTDLLPKTVEFAEGAGKIIAPLDDMVDSFERVNEYKGVIPAAVQLLGNDLTGTVAMMTVLAERVGGEGVEAAVELAQAGGQIGDGLASLVDGFEAVREYEGVGPERFGRLSADYDIVTAVIRSMKERSDINAREALNFREFVEDGVGHIREGFDAIGDLDGLTVHAEVRGSIHGTVATNVDAGSPSGDGGGGSTYDIPRLPRSSGMSMSVASSAGGRGGDMLVVSSAPAASSVSAMTASSGRSGPLIGTLNVYTQSNEVSMIVADIMPQLIEALDLADRGRGFR